MMGLGALAAVTTAPNNAPASAPAASLPAAPSVNIDVVNWTVFVTDVSNRDMNRREAFFNTLPPFINDSRREPEIAKEFAEPAMLVPIGMVRITPDGLANPDISVDVELSYTSGRVLGHWPPGKVRSSGLLWRDVHFAGPTEKQRDLPQGGEGAWLAPARKLAAGEKLLAVENSADAFLLYDVELNYPVALQVTTRPGDAFSYNVAQANDAPMHDLVLYKTDSDGAMRTAQLATLGKATPVAAPSPSTASAPAHTAATRVARRPVTTATAWMAAGTQAGQQTVAEAAPPIPTLVGGLDVSLQKGALPEDHWRRVLTDARVSPPDIEMILTLLKQNVEGKHLTAVYRMDPAELDKVMPLEIVPTPKKVSRIALVVVTGIDPSVNEELASWIQQLGDASWNKREAAMKAIEKLGQRAKPSLLKALKDKDVEVVYRAEQLLEMLNPGQQPPN
jgi:hypothetical protein